MTSPREGWSSPTSPALASGQPTNSRSWTFKSLKTELDDLTLKVGVQGIESKERRGPRTSWGGMQMWWRSPSSCLRLGPRRQDSLLGEEEGYE
ncbi:uncharacterized protein J3R85_004303 [Psidium guajava]|nr:uncharacterized protein J3R85_004303 [Psidium guajava]